MGAGRNVRLGRPGCYVRDEGRLVAVGGTRSKSTRNLKIVPVPRLTKTEKRMVPFEIDDEFASFSASAVVDRSVLKVDIRELKRLERQRIEEEKKEINKETSLVDRMLRKLRSSSSSSSSSSRSSMVVVAVAPGVVPC